MSIQEFRGLHEVRAQARTDELTGLPNRRSLLERMRAALAATGDGRPVALLLLDLDGFEEVNDSLGHAAGDDLLRQVGPRLWPQLGAGELLAHLDLVENTLMADPDRGRTVLGELRRLGVRSSIDDYGTGYSSLAYLRHLPADELKLDRSLIRDVGRDDRATAIVRHTVALAHDLGLTLVAEGVENEETAGVLAALSCDVAQGWAIARPMPVEDFLGWLADHPAPLPGRPPVPSPRMPALPRGTIAR